jgi:RNA polymerase sigma-70 factor, ECF subfamily
VPVPADSADATVRRGDAKDGPDPVGQLPDRFIRLRRPARCHLKSVQLPGEDLHADVDDWAQIADLYAALGTLGPSPVVRVNHAAAVGFAHGPRAGLRLLRPLLTDPALDRYQPLHATHAELLRQDGDLLGAAQAYQRAIELTENTVERAELRRRLDAAGGET